MTVDVYGHLVPGANKVAVDRLDVTGRNPRATTNKRGVTACAVTPREDLVELRGLEPLTPRLPGFSGPFEYELYRVTGSEKGFATSHTCVVSREVVSTC